MNLQQALSQSITDNLDRISFVINEKEYTYRDLAKSISGIRKMIQESLDINENHIGLIANDDIQTYAAIFAIWFEGKSYIPLDPQGPEERNQNILNQTKIKSIIDSSDKTIYPQYNVILSRLLVGNEQDLAPKKVSDESIAYILFTSGTTGIPKGVPISFANLMAFCDAFFDFGVQLDENDKCLQMFGLTFDVSVMSFMLPVLKGARVYTIPKEEIKFSYIFQLIQDEGLTYALMVPSILHYLRPYFDEINSPYLKYSLFCGEGLPVDIINEWAQRLPNAKIMNVYGPTESTMLCTGYKYDNISSNKTHNGVISIGKPWKGVETIIINESNEILDTGEKGELCLAGSLLTSGYWMNPQKNEEAFFYTEYNGQKTRFYKTGDLSYIDVDGDIMFLGRIDFQAKVQGGYRVELSEVELYAKKGLHKINAVAIAYTNEVGSTEIGLVIESKKIDLTKLTEYMKAKMPSYMIPSQIKFIETYPLNINGKIDRKELIKIFN